MTDHQGPCGPSPSRAQTSDDRDEVHVNDLDDATRFASTCREVVGLVTDYLDGALPDVVRALFEEHLGECDGCRVYVDQIRATISAVGRLRVEALPPATQLALVVAFRDLLPGDRRG